ncbi:MAG: class I SAM-dependent methyltransferase [Myxococcota bacterium]|nr:class I SAM-dependent methyltransferase [Myxococcota bacterium]
MRTISNELFAEMARLVSDEDRDEMAIPSYTHKNPALRWMAWRRVELMQKAFAKVAKKHRNGSGLHVMDFGCGCGVLFPVESKNAAKVYGVDLEVRPGRLLVERYNLDNVEVIHPDEAEQTIPEGSLDVIVAGEVLEHVPSIPDTLDFFKRLLKPGGQLLISLPTENRLYQLGRKIAGFHGHYHHDNASSIHAMIKRDADFKTVSRKMVPLPGPLAIYWMLHYELKG